MEKEAAGIRFQTEDDEPRMENLMHHVNELTLMEEHRKQSRKKATGIDGVTKDEYDVNVNENLRDLVERMKKFSYRPMSVRRMYAENRGAGKKKDRTPRRGASRGSVMERRVREDSGVGGRDPERYKGEKRIGEKAG